MTDSKPKPRRIRTVAETGTPRRRLLGQWLVDTMPCGENLDSPGERQSAREVPFADGDAE